MAALFMGSNGLRGGGVGMGAMVRKQGGKAKWPPGVIFQLSVERAPVYHSPLSPVNIPFKKERP
jgi:hypothetical protein